MLAQNFKSAVDLGITEGQLSALQKTLVMLETGALSYWDGYGGRYIAPEDRKFSGHFNMNAWSTPHECGTSCCIGGTAEMVGGLEPFSLMDASKDNESLRELFYPDDSDPYAAIPTQAATALRSYLTTGDARWDLAMARSPQENASE
jgi:hypothetical protein